MGRAQVDIPGPAVLALGGGAAWLVGAARLPAGLATVVLAVGLGLTVWLFTVTRRRAGRRAALHPEVRRRALRLVLVGAALIAAEAVLLGLTPYGELTVPLAAATVGALLLPLASLLRTRVLVALGSALMVLGAVGALVALNTVGTGHQAMVGLLAGVLLWLAAAHQVGLLHELRDGSRR